MTAEGTAGSAPEPLSVDKALALAATDREQLVAALGLRTGRRTPWRVVRQYNHLPEAECCTHRWEWVADLCAYRRTAGHSTETGAFYTVRRATS